MKRFVVGILAHVDAGKTTLSENMLYVSGAIRKLGRVDNQDAFLDTDALERARGITIFSKQAILNFGETEICLLDTPGHVDFSAEMERTLQVLDYAILVISGADGVQSHTRTVWELLRFYEIPTFIFVNKMDQDGTDRQKVLDALHAELGDRCVAFDRGADLEDWHEHLALCDEAVMEDYLETGLIEHAAVVSLIKQRKTFPVYFGSALKQIGTEDFMEGFLRYTQVKSYADAFGAKVYKITRDDQGNRLTHMKVTGGRLQVKDVVRIRDAEDKVNQIRMYSGEKYRVVNALEAGAVCAVTGLTKTQPGDGLGIEAKSEPPRLEPVLTYKMVLPEAVNPLEILPKLQEIEEEEPELQVVWNELLQEINIQVMGAVQLEILTSIIQERFGVAVSFDEGEVVYKETIETICEGVGHFEPLRHYSEVHLLLEPGERGSGMIYDTDCSEDILEKRWQRLVVTHLHEKIHRGVLTGSPVTDMKVTLVTGRAHNKHTVGGDFREATFRALRQGLMEAQSILLEPYYAFRLTLPEQMVGRAMTDISNMSGQCEIERAGSGMTVLTGSAPVVTMRNYQQEVTAYTKGEGRLSLSVKGYDLCHNPAEVIDRIGYDAEQDVDNPTGSVFCAKGSGFLVPWNEVKQHMHMDCVYQPSEAASDTTDDVRGAGVDESFISLEEIDSLINSTYAANQGKKGVWKKAARAKDHYYTSLSTSKAPVRNPAAEEYLLVDGYNIIHAWDQLADLAKDNMEAARQKLMDILSNYQPLRKCKIMVVFDAYRVEGRKESVETHHNIQVVYTAEAQTADHFIEKFAHTHKAKYRITVATSDGLQQIIIRGAGALLMSARELQEVVVEAQEQLREEHLETSKSKGLKMEEFLSDADKKKLKDRQS